MRSRSNYLSTAEAAELLAVSVSTVKRWVDEGILPAHVTAGGHRKLLRAEVLALARQSALPRGDLAAGLEQDSAAAQLDMAELSAALVDALLRGDGSEVTGIVRRAYRSGVSVENLADRIVSPAMSTVGHQWESARLDIWQEHRGTQLCAAALFELKEELESRAERNRPVAIGGAPEGDPYLLPSLLAELVLLDAGWKAVNLGPNTPLASLARAVTQLRPRLIWITVTYLHDRAEFVKAYNELYRTAEQLGAAVAIGGQALVEQVRSELIYTTYGDGLNHLAALARTLHPRPKRPKRGRPRGDSIT